MKIGLLLLATGRRAGGPETYEVELVRGLAQIDTQNEYFIYCTEENAPQVVGIQQENVHYRVLRPRNRWLGLLFGLQLQMKRDGVKLLHCTYAPPPLGSDYVFTMHCVSNLVHPEYYDKTKVARLNVLHRRGMKQAKSILCVSGFVRDQLIGNYGVESARTSVVYNGVGKEFHVTASEENSRYLATKYGINKPYILYVGKLQARKNILRLTAAYELFRRTQKTETMLVMVGRRTETDEGISEAIARSPFSSDILHIGYTPPPGQGQPSDLPILYGSARMFVLPSLFEGFGIPLVEAMACGVPILTSNTTSLPEIAGDAAILADPMSVESIAQGMCQLESSEDLRRELIARGLDRVRLFTWENCARQTLHAYSEATPGL